MQNAVSNLAQPPLSGLKVLDFSTLLPGPFATLMLADLGADVLHIERRDDGILRYRAADGTEGSKVGIASSLLLVRMGRRRDMCIVCPEYEIAQRLQVGVVAGAPADLDQVVPGAVGLHAL